MNLHLLQKLIHKLLFPFMQASIQHLIYLELQPNIFRKLKKDSLSTHVYQTAHKVTQNTKYFFSRQWMSLYTTINMIISALVTDSSKNIMNNYM